MRHRLRWSNRFVKLFMDGHRCSKPNVLNFKQTLSRNARFCQCIRYNIHISNILLGFWQFDGQTTVKLKRSCAGSGACLRNEETCEGTRLEYGFHATCVVQVTFTCPLTFVQAHGGNTNKAFPLAQLVDMSIQDRRIAPNFPLPAPFLTVSDSLPELAGMVRGRTRCPQTDIFPC